jgi:hypothetical protein
MGGKGTVAALRQCDKAPAPYLFLHGSGQRTGSRGVRFRGTALENQIRVIGDLGSRRYGGRAHGTADDRLVGIDMVDRTARPAATQEHGEHAVVTAQGGPGKHAAVHLGKLVDVPRIGDTAPTAEIGLDKQDQSAFMGGGVPTVRSLLAITATDQDIPLDGLLAAFENDRIIHVFLSVDDNLMVVRIAVIGFPSRLYVVFPQQGDSGGKRDFPGCIPRNVSGSDLTAAVIVQLPFCTVRYRTVTAQHHVAFPDGRHIYRPPGDIVL